MSHMDFVLSIRLSGLMFMDPTETRDPSVYIYIYIYIYITGVGSGGGGGGARGACAPPLF